MHELPPQTQRQQAHARPVSGEELEVMGKHAAARFMCGDFSTLSDAVVETVKKAGLAPEQVRRVVEFTNQSAYQQEFQKEGAAHKYIEFHGGPADPGVILQDLNDGGGGTVFDRGTLDYRSAPSFKKTAAALIPFEKTASGMSEDDAVLEEAFKVAERIEFPTNPFQEVEELREKIAAEHAGFQGDLTALELDHIRDREVLYNEVKQAAIHGVPLGHVVQAWATTHPEAGLVKAAFSFIGPKLVEDEVMSLHDVVDSLMKTASSTLAVNMRHPLVETFHTFGETLMKMAHVRAALKETEDAHEKLEFFMRKGAGVVSRLAGEGGLVPKAWAGAKNVAQQASVPAAEAAAAVGGPTVGKAIGNLVQYSPHIAAAIGAKEVYDRGIKHGPGQIPIRYAKSQIPGTVENYQRELSLQQGMFGR